MYIKFFVLCNLLAVSIFLTGCEGNYGFQGQIPDEWNSEEIETNLNESENGENSRQIIKDYQEKNPKEDPYQNDRPKYEYDADPDSEFSEDEIEAYENYKSNKGSYNEVREETVR